MKQMTTGSISRKTWRQAALAVVVMAGCGAAMAQTGMAGQMGGMGQRPINVVNLSAQGTVEVKQDWMTATLSATKDGRDAATVQSQLQKVVESAMSTLRKGAQTGQMEVSSGNFSISPRYGNTGKVEGWQGQTEIVLQGRDFSRITQAAANVQDMTMGSIGFGLSREAREKVEGEAQAKAIENFRQRAAAISKSFGFAGYSLRDVSVSSGGGFVRPQPQPRMMAMAMSKSMDAQPIAVESDKAEVTVSVSGSVQMQ